MIGTVFAVIYSRKEVQMNKFKTEQYLANSGIVYGMYGGIGYVGPSLEFRKSLKRGCRLMKLCFKNVLSILF